MNSESSVISAHGGKHEDSLFPGESSSLEKTAAQIEALDVRIANGEVYVLEHPGQGQLLLTRLKMERARLREEWAAEVLEPFKAFGLGRYIIGPARPDDGRTVWIEVLHERAERYAPKRTVSGGRGRPEAVELDEVIKLGMYSAYAKAVPRGTRRPWQLVWSGTGEPLGVGLFENKESAEAWRKR
jgi:hypothetical protein